MQIFKTKYINIHNYEKKNISIQHKNIVFISGFIYFFFAPFSHKKQKFKSTFFQEEKKYCTLLSDANKNKFEHKLRRIFK